MRDNGWSVGSRGIMGGDNYLMCSVWSRILRDRLIVSGGRRGE
jgi:hypothetical protein